MIGDTDTTAAPATASQEWRMEPELRKALEAILLVVDEPVDVDTLAQVLEVPSGDVEDGLIALAAEYVEQGRGFVLRRVGGGWRMYTDPGAARYVEQFVLHGRTGRLSQAALETLAIVAYKQPVTRSAISQIRGVDADSGVRKLVSRGLVEEVGREETPGQPLLYGTTSSFLEKLGLDALEDLPGLPDLSPQGPPPPEPAVGGYKAARKELTALADRDDPDGAGGADGAAAEVSAAHRSDADGPDADNPSTRITRDYDTGADRPEDEEIDRILSAPTPKPGERLTALLDDPFTDEEPLQDEERLQDDDALSADAGADDGS